MKNATQWYTKTMACLNILCSLLVTYTSVITNTLAVPLQDLAVVDTFPAGFKYVPRVGFNEGAYTNLAQVFHGRTDQLITAQASDTVRFVSDPTFDCTDVIGKVFDDGNLNGYQDEGEVGLPSVKLVTARGLEVRTDEHGRYHITCAVGRNQGRGTNFIIKLDERSLPTGYRMTTENPRVERTTGGNMLKFNFGAAIHRMVRLDMADAVFEPNSTDILPRWLSRVSLLMEKLVEEPSVLRLVYMANAEDASLVKARVYAVKEDVERRWSDLDCCYKLDIEIDILWKKCKKAGREESE